MQIALEIGDQGGQGGAYGNLGNAYQSLGGHRKGIQYHKKGFKIAIKIGDRSEKEEPMKISVQLTGL